MLRRVVPVMVLMVVGLVGVASIYAAQGQPQAVVVHEWGTFTTVADEGGQAINWTPLGGPTDLPCFVEHYKNRLFKIGFSPEAEVPIEYEAARSALVGKVRMETPVLYFYSPAEATVSVRVRFPQGLITEWYPTAVSNQANVVPSLLADPSVVGGVDWPSVRIAPNGTPAFPTGSGAGHYYAARQTDASPIWVNGQNEKFLFYRGVASFPVPISAALGADGSVQVTNLGADPIPAVILFDNRAGIIRYRLHGALKSSARLEPPTATADAASLRAVLVRVLTDTGLYQKEAEAMVATWRDSWFEEGTRVFYVLPSRGVDAVLPLTVTPAPTAVVRAFVGRMELITPASLVQVETALATNDIATLERQGRFLGPIADRLAARLTSVSDRSRIRAVTNAVFASYVARFGGCQ
jgi:hypothetical protein